MRKETVIVNLKYEPYDIYIGRKGKGHDGYYGNNHPIGYCQACETTHNRPECIKAFKRDFLTRIEEDIEFKNKVLLLKGKRLGCFCKLPGVNIPCHGDVYVEWLDKV